MRFAEKKELYSYIIFALFSFAFCYLYTQASPFHFYNASPDPNTYFSMGKGWVNGYIPYRDTFDQKGPVLYIVYAIGYLLSNDNFYGMYVIQSIFLLVSMIIAYKLSRIFVSPACAFSLSVIYPALLGVLSFAGGTAEDLVSTFQIAGLYLFVRYFRSGNQSNVRDSFLQGILIGLVFLIKFNLILFWFFPLMAVFIVLARERKYRLLLKHLGACCFGFILVLVPFACYFLLVKGFSDFIDCYFIFNFKYAAGNTVPVSFLLGNFKNYIKYHWLIFTVMCSGVLYFTFFSKQISSNILYRLSILLSFASVVCMVIPSMHSYYYIALNVFSFFGLLAIATFAEKYFAKKSLKYVAMPLSVVVGLLLGYTIKRNLFQYDKTERRQQLSLLIDEIKKEKGATVLNLGLSGYVETYNGINPTFKYFFYPNVDPDIMPDIRATQNEYIKNKEPMFIFISTSSPFCKKYYDHYEPLHKNYILVKKVMDKLECNEYFLYKRL